MTFLIEKRRNWGLEGLVICRGTCYRERRKRPPASTVRMIQRGTRPVVLKELGGLTKGRLQEKKRLQIGEQTGCGSVGKGDSAISGKEMGGGGSWAEHRGQQGLEDP